MSDTKETDVTNEPTVQVLHPKRRWVSYFWDTLDKPKEERRFLFKLDAALLTFACLGLSQLAVADRSRPRRANMETRVLHQVYGPDQY